MDLTLANCADAVTVLAATIASGLLGNMKRQMNRMENQLDQVEDRVDAIEQAHGLDTSFYRRKKKQKTSRLRAA